MVYRVQGGVGYRLRGLGCRGCRAGVGYRVVWGLGCRGCRVGVGYRVQGGVGYRVQGVQGGGGHVI